MGEPGNSRGHLSNLSDRLSGLNSGIGSRNLEDSCNSVMGPPSYASVNIDMSLNTLTSLVPPVTTNTGQQSSIYTMPDSSHHQIPQIGSDKSLRPATSPTTPTNCVPNFLRPQRYLHGNRSLSLSGCNSFRGNNTHFFHRRNFDPPQSRSLENLVLNSAAIGQSSAMVSPEDDPPAIEDTLRGEQQAEAGQNGRRGSGDSNKSRHNSTSSVI